MSSLAYFTQTGVNVNKFERSKDDVKCQDSTSEKERDKWVNIKRDVDPRKIKHGNYWLVIAMDLLNIHK